MADTENRVTFRLTCIHPPLGDRDGQPTVFGLQDKKGALEMGERQDDGSLAFTFQLAAKPDGDGGADFSGAVVQGSLGARFVYLSLGYAGTLTPDWIKRIKVPLSGITWEQVETALAEGGVFETSVDGRGAATAKLSGERWIVR